MDPINENPLIFGLVAVFALIGVFTVCSPNKVEAEFEVKAKTSVNAKDTDHAVSLEEIRAERERKTNDLIQGKLEEALFKANKWQNPNKKPVDSLTIPRDPTISKKLKNALLEEGFTVASKERGDTITIEFALDMKYL